MSTVRIQCCAISGTRAQQMRLGAVVLVDLELTAAQRWAAVAELLGTGMSEQEAHEGLQSLFPGWFAQPEPEVSESSFDAFLAAAGCER